MKSWNFSFDEKDKPVRAYHSADSIWESRLGRKRHPGVERAQAPEVQPGHRPSISKTEDKNLDDFWRLQLRTLGLSEEAPFITHEQAKALDELNQKYPKRISEALPRNLWSLRLSLADFAQGSAYPHASSIRALGFSDPEALTKVVLEAILSTFPHVVYLDLDGAPHDVYAYCMQCYSERLRVKPLPYSRKRLRE